MNLILLHPVDRREGDRFEVTGERARHVREVLRAEVGSTLRVGLLDGPRGSGLLTRVDDAGVELDVTFESRPPPRPSLDLVLAIPRPKFLRHLLPQLAALGVDRLVLLRTWRVAKPYLTAHILRPEAYRPLLHDGLAQSRSTHEPRVTVEPLFRPWVEDRAPTLIRGASALAAHPTAECPLADVRVGATERVVLAVGPEGGFVPFEIEALAAAGFVAVSMGERTLRVETACIALLAQIELLRRL